LNAAGGRPAAYLARQPIRPTIRQTGPDTRSVVRIRGGAHPPAIFCVHSSTGGVAEFVELAQHLGPGQQFFGLQSRGLVDDEPPLTTVDDMAKVYLDEVVRVQPASPYLFAAWSMGGYVALDMARRAAAGGREVGGVFLIAPPYEEPRSGRKLRSDRREARTYLKSLDDRIEAASAPRFPAREMLPLWDLNDDPLRGPDEDSDAPVGEVAKQRLKAERVNLVNLWAGHRYRAGRRRSAKPYEGRVVLFVPERDPDDEKRGVVDQWRRMLGREPEIVPVPGTHFSVIRGGGARAIAARLTSEVAAWRRPAAVTP
jgi:thioesterase domain-containing protein